MGADDARAAEPTCAEKVRTVLAAADSLTVLTHARDYDLLGADLHTVDEEGGLLLHVPGDSLLAAEAASAPHGALSVLLKFTDVAPTAVRERVRARVTLAGWLAQDRRPGIPRTDDTVGLRLDTAHVSLETASGPASVGLDELALARPDALAPYEAGMLTHLVDDHGDVVAVLTRLIDRRLVHRATRVLPVALDHHGLTLRLEHATGHHDVRLPFPAPAQDPAQVGDRVQALLAVARSCPRRRSSPSHS